MLPKSFIDVPRTSHFSLQNLPYGVFSTKSSPNKRVGVALGSCVIDISALSDAGLLRGPHLQSGSCFHEVGVEAVRELPTLQPRCSRAVATLAYHSLYICRLHSTHSCPWGEMHGQKPAQR